MRLEFPSFKSSADMLSDSITLFESYRYCYPTGMPTLGLFGESVRLLELKAAVPCLKPEVTGVSAFSPPSKSFQLTILNYIYLPGDPFA